MNIAVIGAARAAHRPASRSFLYAVRDARRAGAGHRRLSVRAGRSVFHNLFDHTSVLKFLGEKFGGGRYSKFVDSRTVESLSAVVDATLLDPNTPVRPAPQKP
jgi:hypothetical protein